VPTILVLSDTHLLDGEMLPEVIRKVAGSVDLIIHAGDFTSDWCFQVLNRYAPLIGVRGNMDAGIVMAQLPDFDLAKYEGVSIAITHGNRIEGDVAAFARKRFKHPDLFVFGHTHTPCHRVYDDLQILNPGSVTRPRATPTGTYALVRITSSGLSCQIESVTREI